MSHIRSKNTTPEIIVRQILWSKGKRYRVHSKSIFGTPDISLKRNKVAVFIDGCFWHGCNKCYRKPKTNVKYWKTKILRNKLRRKKVISTLRSEGWHILQFWEHDINKNPHSVIRKIENVW